MFELPPLRRRRPALDRTLDGAAGQAADLPRVGEVTREIGLLLALHLALALAVIMSLAAVGIV